jgi:transposase-like protein
MYAAHKCSSDQITRVGKSASGEQRYRCHSQNCLTITFMLGYRYTAYRPGIKEQVVDRAINDSGVRDTVIGLLINKVEFGVDIHQKMQV